jgi:hypothetical protein
MEDYDYEKDDMRKVLDFLYSIQLIEFKEILDDTENKLTV